MCVVIPTSIDPFPPPLPANRLPARNSLHSLTLPPTPLHDDHPQNTSTSTPTTNQAVTIYHLPTQPSTKWEPRAIPSRFRQTKKTSAVVVEDHMYMNAAPDATGLTKKCNHMSLFLHMLNESATHPITYPTFPLTLYHPTKKMVKEKLSLVPVVSRSAIVEKTVKLANGNDAHKKIVHTTNSPPQLS